MSCISTMPRPVSLPEPVIAAMVEFEAPVPGKRRDGASTASPSIASQRYWHAHEKVAEFIGGKDGITVFTKNTTESVNMVAQGIGWKPGDRVATTILEHHSNLLPWRRLARQGSPSILSASARSILLDLAALERAMTGIYPARGGHAGIKRARRRNPHTGDREDLP